MKIGIYKPFKKVYFHDDKEDNAAWSFEVTTVAKILARQGHKVSMLSDTDLRDGAFINIDTSGLNEIYDRIILFSGTFSLDKEGEGIIDILKGLTPRLDFMLTDLRLVPEDKSKYEMFDTIYTQATKPIESIGHLAKQKYGAISEFILYKHEWDLSTEEMNANKSTTFYFGGTERGRLDDFIEYVWRPNHVITTKSAFFQTENRVNRHEYMKLLDDTKYSIVIADVDYNENSFITPRPYEYYIHDIVAFVDSKFDPDGHIVPVNDWCRVSSFKEMQVKINYLEENEEERMQLLMKQRLVITDEHITGSYVYETIK